MRFYKLNLVNFQVFLLYKSEWIVGTLCAQLLLQFYTDSVENSRLFLTWSENVHVVWIKSSDYFHHLQIEHSHFSGVITIKVNR